MTKVDDRMEAFLHLMGVSLIEIEHMKMTHLKETGEHPDEIILPFDIELLGLKVRTDHDGVHISTLSQTKEVSHLVKDRH